MSLTRKREIRTCWLNFRLTRKPVWLAVMLSWIVFGRPDGWNHKEE